MIPLLLMFACFPVDGPKLLARHLAAAWSEFARLSPETEVAHAPAPGATRNMHPGELQSLAAKHGIDIAPRTNTCFEWRMEALNPALVEEEMRRSLPEDARLEILELSHFPVPNGRLEFPLLQLKAGLWRGAVRYGEREKFDVWARVKVMAKQTRVVTTVPLKAGERVNADQLRTDEVEQEPDARFVTTVEEAAGKVTRGPFAAGAALTASMLVQPPAVLKGDTVKLHAKVGSALVTVPALAQTSGKPGDWIPVKNASSGHVVRARVSTAGEVVLEQ